MNCTTLLAQDIGAKCGETGARGLEREGILINWEDIAIFDKGGLSIEDSQMRHVAITMKTGKKAFKIVQPAKTPFAGTKSDLVEGTYENTFTHELGIVVRGLPEISGSAMAQLANGKFIAILENPNKTGYSFQVYGAANGLKVATGTSEKWSDELNGWAITLKEAGNPYPYEFFGSDEAQEYVAAAAAVKALLVAKV